MESNTKKRKSTEELQSDFRKQGKYVHDGVTKNKYVHDDQRFNNPLDYEYEVATTQLSITSLLASPERDYVITNKGEHVPIHKLEDKVVGLFFFSEEAKYITWKFKLAYEELSKNMEDFEVVLIPVPTHIEDFLIPISPVIYEDAFRKSFKEMPWLAIPFEDTCCSRKLLRIFKHTICDPGPGAVSKLVIIGPHGKFIEPFGAHILLCYGIPAYPFTRSSAIKSIIETVKDVKPEMLWNLDTVFTNQRYGCKVQFSQIVGKRIILLHQNYYGNPSFGNYYSDPIERELNKLKAFYHQRKGTKHEFEVIHIIEGEGGKFNGKGVVSPFPWLTLPRFDSTSDASRAINRFFNGHFDGLVAFDRDGTLVRITHSLKIGRKNVFPFYGFDDMENEFDDMEDEVLPLVENFFSEQINMLTELW